MKQLMREKVHFTVAKEIEKFILENGLKKGDSLPSEKQIAEMLGIGRSSVREGVRLLEGMGMVEARPGKGLFINNTRETTIMLNVPVDPKTFMEVLDVREPLEIEVSRLAIRNATAEDRENIRAALENLAGKVERREHIDMEDMNLHLAIYKAAHNDFLRAILESVVLIYLRAWEEPFGVQSTMLFTFPWHKELVEAIFSGDERTTERCIRSIIAHDRIAVNTYIPKRL